MTTQTDMSMDQKLDKILVTLEEMQKERLLIKETWNEFSPIIKLAMDSASTYLEQWEEKGYFAFAKGLGTIVDEVLSNYNPEDVEQLAKSVVGILDTVRTLTQDDVLQIAGEAAEAIHSADSSKPLGVRGIIKSGRDEDVRRGMGMMVEVLRHLGKGAKSVQRGAPLKRARINATMDPRHQKLASLLAPKKRAVPKFDKIQKEKPHEVKKKDVAKNIVLEGIELDSDGFFVDPNQWNEELAVKMAKSLGFNELSDEHWNLIRYSRQEYMSSSMAPNMRKLCSGSGVATKEVFKLFPVAPAKTIAKIAGIHKPVGCI